MSTIPATKTDREAIVQALAAGSPVDPEVRQRIEARMKQLREKTRKQFSEELSVELVRSIRDE